MSKINKSTYVLVFGLFFCAILFGAGLGIALAQTKYIIDNVSLQNSPLPFRPNFWISTAN